MSTCTPEDLRQLGLRHLVIALFVHHRESLLRVHLGPDRLEPLRRDLLYSYGRDSYGLYSYGLYSYGRYNHGLYSYGHLGPD